MMFFINLNIVFPKIERTKKRFNMFWELKNTQKTGTNLVGSECPKNIHKFHYIHKLHNLSQMLSTEFTVKTNS
jgi:hypothetical protein